jgi:hypothetical protein
MARKSHIPDFAGLLRLQHSFCGAAFGEKAIGILQTDIFVELPEVNVIYLQPLQ